MSCGIIVDLVSKSKYQLSSILGVAVILCDVLTGEARTESKV